MSETEEHVIINEGIRIGTFSDKERAINALKYTNGVIMPMRNWVEHR